jgi:hypothetical protein
MSQVKSVVSSTASVNLLEGFESILNGAYPTLANATDPGTEVQLSFRASWRKEKRWIRWKGCWVYGNKESGGASFPRRTSSSTACTPPSSFYRRRLRRKTLSHASVSPFVSTARSAVLEPAIPAPGKIYAPCVRRVIAPM